MARTFGSWALVVFVSNLIAFLGYSSQIFIIWPWYGSQLSVELVLLLLPFNALLFMLFRNYVLCVVTDPGHVPPSWTPDTQSGEDYEVKKLTGTPRYCRACDVYKPPRSHHCKQCNKCVLKMDHHCPWVNNCIGHKNQAHFLRFLFYVDITCSYHIIMVFLGACDERLWEYDGFAALFIIFNLTFCAAVLLAVSIFSIYHFIGLLGNYTTIEGWEKNRVATLVRRGRIQEVKYPYNIGWRQNIISVFGPNPLLWCWHTTPPGTGLSYPRASGNDTGCWPPRDPTFRHLDPDQDEEELVLPSSPWTYDDNSLNPDLKPSNSQLRSLSANSRKRIRYSVVPPYHPDYDDSRSLISHQSSTDETDSEDYRGPLVRRGSEGYEVKPVDREELLRQYIASRVGEEGRYNTYVAETDIESADEGTSDMDYPASQ